jgi:hypothetical protein
MRRRYVEVVNLISEMIAAGKDAGARAHGQLKCEASLHVLAAGMHAHFHDGLPDRPAITITGEVSNSVKHQASKTDSTGYSM